ncbi:MAG: hypothetical protein R8M45_11250 [Ghiorsea sp.]
MQVATHKLFPLQHPSYYLFGEDRDALFETADAMLADGAEDALRLRVDISELGRIEVESRSQGLFGTQACYALVRNAETATVKQADHLLKLAASVAPENKLMICAAGITWKKAMHKKMLAEDAVVSSEFRMPSAQAFQSWLIEEVKRGQLHVSHDAILMIGERMCGLRQACKQLLERMKLYDHGEGVDFDVALVSELLGERAPDDLESYCHAVAMKSSASLTLLRHLLLDQQVAEVQLLTWLSMRLNHLLMFYWYQASGERSPMQKAKIFGVGKQHIPKEVREWSAAQLMVAVKDVVEAEKLLKGASLESRLIVMERLTLKLITD